MKPLTRIMITTITIKPTDGLEKTSIGPSRLEKIRKKRTETTGAATRVAIMVRKLHLTSFGYHPNAIVFENENSFRDLD